MGTQPVSNFKDINVADAPFVIAQSLTDLDNKEERDRITASFSHAAIAAGVGDCMIVQQKDCVALITKTYDDYQRVESAMPMGNVYNH